MGLGWSMWSRENVADWGVGRVDVEEVEEGVEEVSAKADRGMGWFIVKKRYGGKGGYRWVEFERVC